MQAINCTDPAKKENGFCEDNESLVVKLNKQLGVAIGRCLRYELEHAKEEKLIEDERKMIKDLEKANKVEHDEIVRIKSELEEMTRAKEGLSTNLGEVKIALADLQERLNGAVEEKAALEAELGSKLSERDAEISRLRADFEGEKKRAEDLKREKNALEATAHRDELLDRVASTLASDMKMKSLFEQVCIHGAKNRATVWQIMYQFPGIPKFYRRALLVLRRIWNRNFLPWVAVAVN